MSQGRHFLPGCPLCVKISHSFSMPTFYSLLGFKNCSSSPVFISFEIWWRLTWLAAQRGHGNLTQPPFPFWYLFQLSSCEEWRAFLTSKVILSTKCKCTCEVMKLGSFTQKKTRAHNVYLNSCSLCTVELQQRHSEPVNGAIISNMSYLTKTLSLSLNVFHVK